MSTPDLRVGIAGLGAHGHKHARVADRLGHAIVGADADPEARSTFAETFDAAVHEHPEELFDAGIDAAIVTTPTSLHETVATAALEAGLDVFVEKPLSTDVESAERIAETADRTGQVCMVGFHHLFRNPCRIVSRYADEGYFGELTHVTATFVRRRGVPGRGTWYTSSDIAGGGVLLDIGCHPIAFLLELLDWPSITDVSATTRSEFGPREDYAYLEMWGEDGEARMYDVEDQANAFLEFEGGVTAEIDLAWAANSRSAHTYEVRGTEAGAEVDITNTLSEIDPIVDQRNDLVLNEVRGGPVDHFVDSEVTCRANDPYETQYRTFVEAVASGDPPDRNPVEDGVAVQRAVDRIYRAAEE